MTLNILDVDLREGLLDSIDPVFKDMWYEDRYNFWLDPVDTLIPDTMYEYDKIFDSIYES